MLARLVARPAARGLRARTLSIRRFSTAALPFTLSHSSRISPLPVPDPPPHDHGPDACIAVSGNGLVLRRGGGRDQAISARWLRDHCRCAACRNRHTGQRQVNVLGGGVDCRVSEVLEGEGGDAVVVRFGDGHEAEFSKRALLRRESQSLSQTRQGLTPLRLWGAEIAPDPPTVEYERVRSHGLAELLRAIRRCGFAFVAGLPPTPDATERLLESIGPIRNTHYGAFYDFTADLSSKDTAYTSEALDPHTDNTYFSDPAGLQALHLLEHTHGAGGASLLVDGFAAAHALFRDDPDAYRLLAAVPVLAHASGNKGVSLQPAVPAPVLAHHPHTGQLAQVRWNNADRAGLVCDHAGIDAWYDAASKFSALLSAPASQYIFQLVPGRLLIFDNWRVLHGRTAFTGRRRVCGAYINRDDFVSRFRATNLGEGEVGGSTVTG